MSENNNNIVSYIDIGNLIFRNFELGKKEIPLTEPMNLQITFSDYYICKINNKLSRFTKSKELIDGKIMEYTCDDNQNIKLCCNIDEIRLYLSFKEIDNDHKNDYLRLLEKIKLENGRDLVTERKMKITTEIENVKKIKDYILNEKIHEKFNYKKDKHIKSSLNILNFKNTDRKDIYGMFTTRLLDTNIVLNRFDQLNQAYNFPHKKINIDDESIHETEKNSYIKEIIYKYLLLTVLKTIDEYINGLHMFIKNIETDSYYICSDLGMNDVIKNKIIEITDSNRNLIELEDHYDKIFVIKDYYTPGIVRTESDFYTANCIILCRSKLDRGGLWNIFPGSYKIGDTDKITLDIIEEFEEMINLGKK